MSDLFERIGRDKFVATYKKEKIILNTDDMEAIESELAFI